MLLYRPRHSAPSNPARVWRTLLTALVTAELLVGAGAAGGLISSTLNPANPPGVVGVTPNRVPAGARAQLTFTIRAGKGGVQGGHAEIAVPQGWSPPSVAPADPGEVTTDRGNITVEGRLIRVTDIRLFPRETVTVTYGGGVGGATEPTTSGSYRFESSVAARQGSWNNPNRQATLVSVVAPAESCRTLTAPAGVGNVLPLENGAVVPNLYNAYSSAGVLQQCTGSSGVSSRFSLHSAKPVSYGPLGYPEIAYGDNLDDQPFCSGCPTTPFPLPVSDLLGGGRPLRVSIKYSLGASRPSSLPRDFIYDVWLEKSPQIGEPPERNDVELLIFLYQQNIATCLPAAASGTLAVDMGLDGSTVPSSWTVCPVRGGTSAAPLAFFLQHPAQSESASVTLPLGDFITAAGAYLNRDLTDHMVMGLEVGGEFNQCSTSQGCLAADSEWGWSVQSLTILDEYKSIPVVFSDQPRSRRAAA